MDTRLELRCKCKAANIDGLDPVNFGDFAILGTSWSQTGSALPGDTNKDGTVDIWDLLQVAEHWLEICSQP